MEKGRQVRLRSVSLQVADLIAVKSNFYARMKIMCLQYISHLVREISLVALKHSLL